MMNTQARDGNIILTTESGEIHIEGGVHVQNFLQTLDEVDKAIKRQIQQRFVELTREQPENARFHLALGLTYLSLKLYPLALRALDTALARAPVDPDIFYFQAVARVHGRSLSSLRNQEAREIDDLLTAAMMEDPSQGIYPYFLGLLKRDFYRKHGLREGSPTAQQLLSLAHSQQLGSQELSFLHEHIKVRPSHPQ